MTPSESVKARLRLTDEEREALDARIKESHHASPTVEWLDPGPDPFGMDWSWIEPEPRGAAEPSPVVPPPTIAVPRRPFYRRLAYAGGGALAASLLLAVGITVGTRLGGDGVRPLAGAVSVDEATVRGPGTAIELKIENRSDRRAFVTVVGLVPGKRPVVYYRESQQFMEVRARAVRAVDNLPASFEEAVAVLVVLSPTPVGEAVRQVVQDGLQADRPDEARKALKTGLEALEFRGFTIETAPLPKRKG